jgi:UDPglucose 6-dehydrogenase
MNTPHLKIAVIDAGLVGLSSAILLSQRHQVIVQDDIPVTVQMVNAGLCPHDDREMGHQLEYKTPGLRATHDIDDAVEGTDLVLIATPTDFDDTTRTVDTSRLDEVIVRVQVLNPEATLVIESTVPVGYTARISRRLSCHNLFAAPALLRPGLAMHDRLRPARLVVGDVSPRGTSYAQLMQTASELTEVPVVLTDSDEAEAIQLFAQKQLLTEQPVSFTELERYARRHRLDLMQLHAGLGFELQPEPQLDQIVVPSRVKPPRRAPGQHNRWFSTCSSGFFTLPAAL